MGGVVMLPSTFFAFYALDVAAAYFLNLWWWEIPI